jgi:RNA polymerase primary sigma factor
MLDVMAPDDGTQADSELMVQSLRDEVALGLSSLSTREMEVISAYYGLTGQHPMSLDEIGELYGLTRERVRQIKERGLRRLRKIHSNDLKNYLG